MKYTIKTLCFFVFVSACFQLFINMDHLIRLQLANNLLQIDNDINDGVVAVQAQRRRRRRLLWSSPWLQRRQLFGWYEHLMMEAEDPASFNELLQRLGPTIAKRNMWYCKTLHPGLRLAITLRFMATGDSYHSLMYGFRMAHNMISLIARDVCQAIIDIYEDEVVSCPTTEAAWRGIANRFGE